MLSIYNRVRNTGERIKNYMIVKTSDWDSIRRNQLLGPILLKDIPDFTEVFFRRLGGNSVIWYIYQDNNGHKELVFKSETPQELRL